MTDLATLRDWRFSIDPQGIAWAIFDREGESQNSLGRRPLEELAAIVERVEAGAKDKSITGLAILSGKEKGFIVGADVREFEQIKTEADVAAGIAPVLAMLDRIEAMAVPVVCGIHGFCLGGGLELALACHWRIATRDDGTRLGFPEVRLGIFPTLGPYLLPHIVPNIVQRFPELELILIEEKTEVLLKKLHDGELDAAVLALPIHDDSLHAEFLFEETFVLALNKQHRLAKAKRVKLADLANESLLLLDDGHCLRDQALEVCQMAGAGERSGFRATSLETLRHMVSANVGVTLMPALSVHAPAPPSPNVTLIPFAEPAPHRRIAMIWRRTSALTAFLHQLVPMIRQIPAGLLKAPK